MEKFENTYSENKITFAVFGDIHGALDSMFAVCESYENIYSENFNICRIIVSDEKILF